SAACGRGPSTRPPLPRARWPRSPRARSCWRGVRSRRASPGTRSAISRWSAPSTSAPPGRSSATSRCPRRSPAPPPGDRQPLVDEAHIALGLLAEPEALGAKAILAQDVLLDEVRQAATAALPSEAEDVPDLTPYREGGREGRGMSAGPPATGGRRP